MNASKQYMFSNKVLLENLIKTTIYKLKQYPKVYCKATLINALSSAQKWSSWIKFSPARTQTMITYKA